MSSLAGHLLLAASLLGIVPAGAGTSTLSDPDSSAIAYGAGTPARASAYREHAPLAWFSLGSLAMGGVFYGIQAGMSSPRINYVAGDRSQMTLAMGAAGLTALAAAAAYFYFSHEEAKTAWDARLSGGVDGQGRVNASAALVFPLPGNRP